MITLFTSHLKKWLTVKSVAKFQGHIQAVLRDLTADEFQDAIAAFEDLTVLVQQERVRRGELEAWKDFTFVPDEATELYEEHEAQKAEAERHDGDS